MEWCSTAVQVFAMLRQRVAARGPIMILGNRVEWYFMDTADARRHGNDNHA
jgi:hypothetical protein